MIGNGGESVSHEEVFCLPPVSPRVLGNEMLGDKVSDEMLRRKVCLFSMKPCRNILSLP